MKRTLRFEKISEDTIYSDPCSNRNLILKKERKSEVI